MTPGEWVEEKGLHGVRLEEIPVDLEAHPTLRLTTTGGVRITTHVPYDDPHPLRTLIGRMLEQVTWIDCTKILIVPLAPHRSFVCKAEFMLYDPLRCFESPMARQILSEGSGDTQKLAESLGETLLNEVEEFVSSLDAEQEPDFRGGLVAFLTPGIWSGKDEQLANFENSLRDDLRPIIRDLRMVIELPRRHLDVVKTIDEWIHQERESVSGEVRGMRYHPSPWTSFDYFQNKVTVEEMGVPEGAGGPDPALLLGVIADDSATTTRRQEALRALQSLPHPDRNPWLIRAAGHDEVRLNAFHDLVKMPEMIPFLREIVFARDAGRIARSLDRLRDYTVAFDRPEDAWNKDAPVPGTNEALGGLYQKSILTDLGWGPDRSLASDLIAELNTGNRPPAWMEAAIGTLTQWKIPEAADVVAKLVEHPEPFVKEHALRYFGVADHPPILNTLLESLSDPDLDVVSAADQGISGQLSAGWEVFLDALDMLHQRAIQIDPQDAKDFLRNSLGVNILHSLPKLKGPCPQPDIVRSSLRRVRDRYAEVAHQVLKDPKPEPKVRYEKDVVGAAPNETYTRRMELWREPGYAAIRYRKEGHRDPKWDEFVEEAHQQYDPAKQEQDTEAIRQYREAVDRGCEDGMVLYRLAVCLFLSKRESEALEFFIRAIDRIPERYSDNPYPIAAANTVGYELLKQGRTDEALVYLKKSVAPDMHEYGAPTKVADLEESHSLLKEAASGIKLLDTGSLGTVPSRHHPARVTSMEITAEDVYILSADMSGTIQITTVIEDVNPELKPEVSARAHDPGLTHVTWLSPPDKTFLSAGVDGRIRKGAFPDGENLKLGMLHQHDHPVTALCRTAGGAAFADDQGDVYLLSPRGDKRKLERKGSRPVTLLRHRGSTLIGIEDIAMIEAWSPGLQPEMNWHAEVSDMDRIVFADIAAPDLLIIGSEDGKGMWIRLSTGALHEVFPLPRRKGLPRFARVNQENGLAVWGYPSGAIIVDPKDGQGGLTAITQPVTAMDVCFERHLVVHADTANNLGVHRYQGGIPPQ